MRKKDILIDKKGNAGYYNIYLQIFAVYTFLLTMTLKLNDDVIMVNPGQHYMGTFALGSGFLLFYIERRFYENINIRRYSILAASVIYAMTIAVRIFNEPNLPIVLASALTIGFLGGMVYYNLAAACSITGKAGFTLSVGASIAFLLQFIIVNCDINEKIVYFLLMSGAVVLLLTAFFPLGDYSFESVLPFSDDNEKWDAYVKKSLIIHIGVSLCVLVVMGICEISYVIDQNAASSLYGSVRLFIPAGYFLIGFIYDHKDFKTSSIVMLMLSLFSIAAWAGADFAYIRVMIFYLLVGAVMAYITLGFWDVAPKTHYPDLWAVFGRIIAMAESIVIYLLMKLCSASDFANVLAAALFMALTALLVIISNSLKEPDLVSEKNTDDIFADEKPTKEQIFSEFAAHYRLTPRECDVMQEILKSDAKIKTVATEIGLSDRMVYRYMNQLYQKLGAENRAGILKVWFDYVGRYE